MPSGRSPPPGFGIITRRTGAGRYVFATRSFLIPASHSSSPAASISAKVTPSTPGAPSIGARQSVGVAQNVLAADLVVEQVEAERRLRLRLEIELPLKLPDTVRCCQAHRQSPILVFVESAPEVRVLPSAGITRPHRYHDPVRLPPEPPPKAALRARPSVPGRVSPDYPHHPSDVPCPLPRWTETGASVGCFPTRAAFPVIQAGRRPRLHFRGLLRLHSRYGPPDRSTAQGGLRHEASTRPVTQAEPLVSYQINRQLSGWNLPPLVIRAVGAH